MIRKTLFRFFMLIIVLAVIMGFTAMVINNHVVKKYKTSLIEPNYKELRKYTSSKYDDKYIEGILANADIEKIKRLKPECAIILGAGLKDKNTPSPMLKDRLDMGIYLYKKGIVSKILLSGDDSTKHHNELHAMLKYSLDAGVSPEDVFCDHAGVNTSASFHRAQKIFNVKKLVIVTQRYHEFRALMYADSLGIKAIGVSSDGNNYGGQAYREVREVLARNKDFFKIRYGKDNSMGGESIPISGDGRKSHGE